MMKTIFIFIMALLVVSCTSNQKKTNNNPKQKELTKEEFYLGKMKEKNFQLEQYGPCDDAFDDTIHKSSIAYIESKTLNESNAIIEFKFIDACCQEFSGDYSIENDTLKFNFEQVNNEVCKCLCWYKYRLTINESKTKYRDIIISKK